MKTRYILLSLFLLPAMILARALTVASWQPPENMTLPAAYNHALGALGGYTNGLYCSETAMDSSRNSWTFTFCTTNVPPEIKWVIIANDGKTYLEQPRPIQ